MAPSDLQLSLGRCITARVNVISQNSPENLATGVSRYRRNDEDVLQPLILGLRVRDVLKQPQKLVQSTDFA